MKNKSIKRVGKHSGEDIAGEKFVLVNEGDWVVHMSRNSYDDLIDDVIKELKNDLKEN